MATEIFVIYDSIQTCNPHFRKEPFGNRKMLNSTITLEFAK